ncbi:GGDEF domain-containing protein [Salimicrobium salexigens]|uniref:GGDEF domain-containing protein, diguanylate cyclase (C-di-GMP synthetase) or its enzymatically inactive variants n=1 Tax=Salimicrobium salexigens TaxID=908941 RepID=A0ABY1KY97_9BACI|nr:GGDEF domain-containing protein [Salimicrobium salexigens]SIS90641.1 GGDEF domain-containing protein, diguanylate cyclase (c-di-GMP synthetase) or its enzymatically inactive variants [Salimicrobium salexigens]
MEKPNLIYGLFIVLFTLVAGFLTIEDNYQITYLVVILATGGLFTFLKSSIAFIILISEVIVTGFLLTYDAYQAKLTSIDQLPLVFNHLMFAAIVTVLWIIFFLLKRDSKRLFQMKDKLSRLQRFEEQTNVFTKNEFMEKAKVIWAGLKRRDERGLIIFVSINPSIQHTENAITKTIGNTLITTVRGDFDLVGRYDSNTFIVLLQNTNEKGKEIVLNRFRGLLDNQIDLSNQIFIVSEEELNDTFLETELYSGEAQ